MLLWQISFGHYLTYGVEEPGVQTLELRDRSIMAFQVRPWPPTLALRIDQPLPAKANHWVGKWVSFASLLNGHVVGNPC
eukprot:scaffold309333_cov33-Prasinocladus_malaysianus.AAC.2